jgi:hypothetical protein
MANLSRPRFSLRTLLIVVTVFGCLFGWFDFNRRIVRERKAALGDLRAAEATIYPYVAQNDSKPAPFPRNLLGDKRVYSIGIHSSCDSAAIERVRVAYPESKIIVSRHLLDDLPVK